MESPERGRLICIRSFPRGKCVVHYFGIWYFFSFWENVDYTHLRFTEAAIYSAALICLIGASSAGSSVMFFWLNSVRFFRISSKYESWYWTSFVLQMPPLIVCVQISCEGQWNELTIIRAPYSHTSFFAAQRTSSALTPPSLVRETWCLRQEWQTRRMAVVLSSIIARTPRVQR